MNKSTMEAYAEVDKILSLMDAKYVAEIPEKLRKIFKEKKDQKYNKEIVAYKPLENQNLNRETLSILAVLNYKYWCKDENKKKELMEQYVENERKYQEELKEKFDPDDLFNIKESDENINGEQVENLSMIEVKPEQGIFRKIKNWIMNIFKIK